MLSTTMIERADFHATTGGGHRASPTDSVPTPFQVTPLARSGPDELTAPRSEGSYFAQNQFASREWKGISFPATTDRQPAESAT